MSLSLVYALLALPVVLVVFLIVNRMRGWRFAFLAGLFAFTGILALFVLMASIITRSMP